MLRPAAARLRRNVRNRVVERRVRVVPGEGFAEQVADGFVAHACSHYDASGTLPSTASLQTLPHSSVTAVGRRQLPAYRAQPRGSEGSGIEVYDPRTGKPLKFTYEHQGDDPESHAIRAQLPMPVPEGGVGRVLIYKTYKDPRTYMMNGKDIVWVRSLSGYRLGVDPAEGLRLRLVERRCASVDDARWTPASLPSRTRAVRATP